MIVKPSKRAPEATEAVAGGVRKRQKKKKISFFQTWCPFGTGRRGKEFEKREKTRMGRKGGWGKKRLRYEIYRGKHQGV